MPSYLQRFKEQNPRVSEFYSDDEIIEYLPTHDPQEFGSLEPEQVRFKALDDRGAIRKGFSAGIDQMQAMGGGLAAMAGDVTGADSIKDWGLDVYRRNMEEAALSAPETSFMEIDGVGDALNWAGYTLGNLAPMMATSIAGGGVGGILAGQATKTAAASMLKSLTAKGMAAEMAKQEVGKFVAKRIVLGQALGAASASSGMSTGSLYGETGDAAVSAVHGIISGSIDALPIMRVFGRFGKSQVAKEALESSVIREIAKQGLAESSTEAIQTLVEQHARYWAETEGKSLLGNIGDVDWREVVEAGAAGALGGSAMGGAASVIHGDPMFFRRPTAQKPEDELNSAIDNASRAATDTINRGGDALDSELARAEVEEIELPQAVFTARETARRLYSDPVTAPETPLTVPGQMPNFPSTQSPASDQTIPGQWNQPTTTDALTPSENTSIDAMILAARKADDENSAARLEAAKRMQALSERFSSEGNQQRATNMAERAAAIIEDVKGRLPVEEAQTQESPAQSGERISIWTGRRGDGYETREAAEAGLVTRQRVRADLDWRIEQMSTGKFQLAGYATERPTRDRLAQPDMQAVDTLAQARAQGESRRANQSDPAVRDMQGAAIDRAMRSIESRGGVATQAEADLLAEYGMGAPYDRIEGAAAQSAENVRMSSSGKPFQSERQARSSVPYRQNPGATVIPSGDGFAVQLPAQSTAETVTDATQSVPTVQEDVVLQNRDRSSRASIEQMQKIASKPDYSLAGFSRLFSDGAPVVEPGADVPQSNLGITDTATTSEGRKIPIQYAVLEASTLIPSNRADGTKVPEYGAQSEGVSRAVAGNGRIAGIQRGFDLGTTAEYVEAMAADEKLHGVSGDVIRAMERPVLVRIMPKSEITANIGDESNTRITANLTPAEQAKTDARRVNVDGITLSDDGEITRASVEQFISAMPQTERAGLLDDGKPNRQAYDRLNNLLFRQAYDSDALLRLQAEAVDPEVRTIMAALRLAAPRLARLRDTGAYDIRGLIEEAAEAAVNAKRAGETLASFIQQTDMARSPEIEPILKMMAENIRSAKKIGEHLISLADMFYNESVRADVDMFGEVQKRSRNELMGEMYDNESGSANTQDSRNNGRTEPDDTGAQRTAAEREKPDSSGQVARNQESAEQAAEVTPDIDAAAAQAATSPDNNLPEPTEAQKAAGNYKKGHIVIQGLDISIENPRGSTRSGTDPSGKRWESVMTNHYGYIKRTEGADGEHVDVFIGENPDSQNVFIIDQSNADGSFDEHKIMIGFNTEKDAVEGYKSNYQRGWRVGPVSQVSMREFKDWLDAEDITKPYSENMKPAASSEAVVVSGDQKTDSPPELTTPQLIEWSGKIKEKYSLESFYAFVNGDDIDLVDISVPETERGSGVGSAVMTELTALADRHGKKIVLSPESEKGRRGTTSRIRLVRFYKRFGFVENKGRDKDFTVSESMYREPNNNSSKKALFDQGGIEKVLTAKPNRPGTTTAIVNRSIAKAVEALQAELDVIVVQSIGELPRNLRIQFPENTRNKGAYWNGSVYLVADNIESMRDAQVVLAHELVGHKGVLEMLEQDQWADLKAMIDRLLKMRGRTALSIANELKRRKYGMVRSDNWYAEFMAIAAERREKDGPIASLMRTLREYILRALKAFGLNGPFSVSELDIMLSGAERYLSGRREARGERAGAMASQDGFDLDQYTEQDIAGQELAQTDREKAEALRKQRQQADGQVDDFVLTGSNSEADQAAARGQRSLFSQSTGNRAFGYTKANGVWVDEFGDKDTVASVTDSVLEQIGAVDSMIKNESANAAYQASRILPDILYARDNGIRVSDLAIKRIQKAASQYQPTPAEQRINRMTQPQTPEQNQITFNESEIPYLKNEIMLFERDADKDSLADQRYLKALKTDLAYREKEQALLLNGVSLPEIDRQIGKLPEKDPSLIKPRQSHFSAEKITDTKEFRDWFGDSKVVDANGEPLVVYHGTSERFSEFDKARQGSNTGWTNTSLGFYFIADRSLAEQFAKDTSGGDVVMEAYLSIQKPIRLTFPDVFNDADQAVTIHEILSGERVDPSEALESLNETVDLGDVSDFLEAMATDEAKAIMARDGYDGVISHFGDGNLEYVAFEPEQIKSVDNRGTFDPKNPNILFSKDDSTGFAIPDETLVSVAVRKMQDKFKVLKDLQANIIKAGGDIDENNNAYLAEELFHGKAENDIRQMQEQYVEPLAKKMAQFDISRDQLDQFLYARHARERNARIAQINPEMPDGGSGMTNAEAQAALDAVRATGKQDQYEQLAGIVYDMLQLQRDMVREGGLESDPTIDAWEEGYQFYVPLKGWAEDTKQEGMPRTGKGFAISGKESKRALGRSSQAASPTSFAINDLTEKLIRRRKNEVGNTFLKLVQNNPNPDYWQVFTDEKPETQRAVKKVKDQDTGEMVEQVTETAIPMAMLTDRYFTTKKNGKTFYIKLEDPRLMKAMKNIGPESNGALIRTMAGITRVLSALNTSYSPEFMVSNFARDVQTALLNMQAEQSLPGGKAAGVKIAKKTMKDIPRAMKAIYGALRGTEGKTTEAKKWQALFEQFRNDGAKTGWFDMKDLDGQSKSLDNLVAMAQGGFKGKAMLWAREGAKLVENMNQSVENAVRLAAYANAIEAGISRKQAASLAKNMTVNFNRRGEIGTVLNAIYMFANASIQGTANFVRTMGSLKGRGGPTWNNLNNAQKIAVGMMTGAYFIGLANRMSAGEDEDDENWYDKVPDYVKERNIVIMKSLFGGAQDGSYWKIPLPYGYNVFYVMGNAVEAVTGGGKSIAQSAADVTLAGLGSFSPIGFQHSDSGANMVLKNAAPTIIKPIVEVALNENFMGSSIYTENLPFGTPRPDSALGRNSTPEAYRALSLWLNEVTGGSEYQPGAIDINPDVMQHFLDFFGGSAYAFFGSKVPDAVHRAAAGVVAEENRVPFLSRISGKVMPYADNEKFYQRRDVINQVYDEYRAIPAGERTGFEQAQLLKMRPLLKATERRLSALRKRRDQIYLADLSLRERDPQLKDVEAEMKVAIDRFNKAYNAIDQ